MRSLCVLEQCLHDAGVVPARGQVERGLEAARCRAYICAEINEVHDKVGVPARGGSMQELSAICAAPFAKQMRLLRQNTLHRTRLALAAAVKHRVDKDVVQVEPRLA